MKKVLFVGQSLKVGGVERALVEQLNSLRNQLYEVELLLFSPSGAYLNDLSTDIKLLKTTPLLKCVSLTNAEAKQNILHFVLRSFFFICSKIIGNKRLYSLLFIGMKDLKGYDIAISYFHDGGERGLYYGCNLFVLNKVEAKTRIAWIHSDYTKIKSYTEETHRLYGRFDKVVNVSSAMKRKFDALRIVPENRSCVVYNVICKESIKNKAGAAIFEPGGFFSIITVGRLEREKGTQELFKLAKQLKENGCHIKWSFVGSGNLLKWCECFIAENQLSDTISLTGQVDNPYPLIQNASLLVSGSYSETFGLSIIESLVLGTPVLALRYDAIDEVLNGTNGLVVSSFDDMKNTIERLVCTPTYYSDIKGRTRTLVDYEVMNKKQISTLFACQQ